MTDDLRPWTNLMLSAGVLFTGGLAWYAWERVWIWRRLDIGLLAAILLGSIVVAEPINSQFRRRPEGEIPPEADRLRRRWRRFHLARTYVGLAALACLISAVAYAPPSQGAG